MYEPLDEIAFLANSPNRVAILETLAADPYHRDELLDQIDVSRVTLARILTDLEARQWIERTGQQCRITPLGEWISEEFGALLETMATEQELRELLPCFPTDQLPFDIRCLRDAEIIVPSATNMWAHVQRSADCFRSAQRARALSSQIAPPMLEATAHAVAEHDQRFEAVLTRAVVDTVIADATMEPQFLTVLEAPTTELYVSEEEPPLIVFITDETVGIPLTDDTNVARALLLSEHETVYDWATATINQHRDRAHPITPDAFTV